MEGYEVGTTCSAPNVVASRLDEGITHILYKSGGKDLFIVTYRVKIRNFTD